MRSPLLPALLAAAAPACSMPMTLHPPAMTAVEGRHGAVSVELAPIAPGPAAAVSLGAGDWSGLAPDAVLTAGIDAELKARALRGGDSRGYAVKCTLDRFAVRRDAGATDTRVMASLFADLSCEAKRKPDGVAVFRGELRGRAMTVATSLLSSERGILQQLVDRLVSDVSREMASDLAVRGLGLTGDASHRVFADETVEKALGGMDDGAYGAAALAEDPAAVPKLLAAGTKDLEPLTRAALWNAVAMAAGPGDPWLAGERMHLDDEPVVRFYQYKALARLGSATSFAELKTALAGEEEPLLAELVKDALDTGGIGLPRATRPH